MCDVGMANDHLHKCRHRLHIRLWILLRNTARLFCTQIPTKFLYILEKTNFTRVVAWLSSSSHFLLIFLPLRARSRLLFIPNPHHKNEMGLELGNPLKYTYLIMARSPFCTRAAMITSNLLLSGCILCKMHAWLPNQTLCFLFLLWY